MAVGNLFFSRKDCKKDKSKTFSHTSEKCRSCEFYAVCKNKIDASGYLELEEGKRISILGHLRRDKSGKQYIRIKEMRG